MGVLYDYFRAPDQKTALMLLDEGGGVPAGPTTVHADVDALDAKGIDPHVVFGQLIAFLLDVPWSVDLIETVFVWPSGETEPVSSEDHGRPPADSPWHTGPWLEEFSDRIRDALADVDDGALPEIAERWARIEEFDGYMDAVGARDVIDGFVALARRARQAGDRLYCWCSL